MNVNFSIPVELFDVHASENSLYSYAKLKIFYIGETPDKRLFTRSFSNQLLESLPYVPVVGYYDEEGEDFVGHNQEIQHIYGLVPEDTNIEFLKEDNKEYAVCDVILYTGRKDKTGEIAQKIVGKSHSLELNPEDTTYVVNKDTNGKFINIEFKTGSLLGLSILGDDEKPAFTGSKFFTEQEFQAEIFKKLREFISSKKERGEKMNFNRFEYELQFIDKSYSERIQELIGILTERFGEYFYIEQMFDDYLIITSYDWDSGSYEHYRVGYLLEDGKYVLTEEKTVIKRFLTEEEIDLWEKTLKLQSSEDSNREDEFENIEENIEEEIVEQMGAKNEDVDGEHGFSEVSEETYLTSINQGVENGDEFENNQNTEDKENAETETLLDSEAFTESERRELESLRQEVYGYRREAKLGLLASFEEDLSSEFLDKLEKEVDNFTYESLEIELSKEFTRIARENKVQKQQNFMPFTHNRTTNTNTTSDKNEYIKRLVETHK